MPGYTDIHCHILPGVDDGARDMDESLRMLEAAAEAGITHIYCTPHCRGRSFDRKAITEAYRNLRPHARRKGIALSLGCEVFWRNLVNMDLDNHRLIQSLRMGDTPYFLLEFEPNEVPSLWPRLIMRLQQAGVRPVIAHPERYVDVQRNLRLAEHFIEAGCKLQVSANYIHRGKMDPWRRTAEKLFSRDMVSFLASDAHCVEDYEDYCKALKTLG